MIFYNPTIRRSGFPITPVIADSRGLKSLDFMFKDWELYVGSTFNLCFAEVFGVQKHILPDSAFSLPEPEYLY